MSKLDVSPPDYAVLDGLEDFMDDEEPTTELVLWYDRPGWPLGKLQPSLAIAGAFALGLAVGAAFTAGAFWSSRRDED